jgi:hypothetical protein
MHTATLRFGCAPRLRTILGLLLIRMFTRAHCL